MHVISGVYSSSIMDLDPRGHDSNLREKNQYFGETLVNFTHDIGVLQEVLFCYRRR